MVFKEIIISNKWGKILDTIYSESINSNMDIRLGCGLMENNKLIYKGHNRNDRSRWCGVTMPGIHAEMNATRTISPLGKPKGYCRLCIQK